MFTVLIVCGVGANGFADLSEWARRQGAAYLVSHWSLGLGLFAGKLQLNLLGRGVKLADAEAANLSCGRRVRLGGYGRSSALPTRLEHGTERRQICRFSGSCFFFFRRRFFHHVAGCENALTQFHPSHAAVNL